ncbi:biotin carboxyl carrier protein [Lipingzhangella halophila]|uniref:Biotin carboxyl carrier protein n=1 Tax=Lipingzhangella halophila TaxID=1783352 RepID=A0A7W7W0T1_9ACTN|nr:biotin/lipoyl-binding carrier protein [Lipingzhangella halophila]MBB4929941.1 biotin carboxyl carrier protein [Lipingzhangella halophila]
MAEIRAENAANVFKVTVAPGDELDEGDPVVILEFAKMEIPVVLEDPGTVVSVDVAEGDVVQEGDLLATVE